MHYNHIDATIGCQYNYIRIDNSENKTGICAAYNKGVKKASADILVFIHDDVYCITPNWGTLLEAKFKTDSSLGLIGVAGTQYLFHDNPSWVAAGQPFIHGKVVHEYKDEKKIILSVYSDVNKDINVIAVDGLFFAVPNAIFTSVQFDEVNFNSFHFYDLDICMQIVKTHKVIVTPDILVKHLSGGNFDNSWKYYGNIFLNKYCNELPATCTPEKPDITKRIPFASFNLESMVNAQTFTYIYDLGKRKNQRSDANQFQ
jgi:glycosyltransferase involved in cell wall biosynthesis